MAMDGDLHRARMSAGAAFEARAAGVARLMLVKIALQQPALNGPLLDRQLSYVRELPVAADDSEWQYADFSMRSGSGDPRRVHVVGEIKWTDAHGDSLKNASAQLRKAFRSTVSAAQAGRSPVAMIMLGWSAGSEEGYQPLVEEALRLVGDAAGVDNPPSFAPPLALRPSDDGLPGGTIVDLSVAFPMPQTLGASRWVFVFTRVDRTVDALGAWIAGEVNDAVDELGHALLSKWVDHAANLVVERADRSGAEFALIPEALPHAHAPANDLAATRALLGFMLDPWGKLTRDYVQIARLGEQQRARWSTLIGQTIRGGEDRALKLTRRMMGSYVPPMPVNLGIVRGGLVVPMFRFFNSSRGTAPIGAVDGPPVSILEGGSGSGKTTLIEHVYSLWTDALSIGEDLIEVRELPVFLPVERLIERQLLRADSGDAVRMLCRAALTGAREDAAGHNLVATTNTLVGAEPDGGALRALLLRIPICLFVDGYDQLRPGLQDAFRRFASRLKTSGVKIRRIVLTSRPDSGASNAMDWLDVLTLDAPPGHAASDRPLVCEYFVGPPDEKASESFIEAWLVAAGTLVGTNPDHYTFAAFRKWLANGKPPAAGTPANAADAVDLWHSVSRSPLHTTLALIAYACERAPAGIQTTADLFEALFFELKPLPSHDAARDLPILVADDDARACLESIAFGMLMRPDRIVGEFTPEDVLSHVGAATGAESLTVLGALLDYDADPRRDASVPLRWLRDLPFLVPRAAGSRSSFAFLHVSIEEYLASGHLKRFMARHLAPDGLKVPDARGRPIDAGRLPIDAGGVRCTALCDIVVRLGREAFKYLVAQLRQEAHEPAGERLACHFFAACARDVGLQQYLYDTGYVDVAIDELRLLTRPLDPRRADPQDAGAAALASLALQKFIGHFHYGSSDGPLVNEPLEQLSANLRSHPSSEPTWAALARWYELFVQDHLFNRSSAPGNRRRFEAALPASLALRGPAAPRPEDLLYVLRAGHYYGHLGNHNVSACDRLAADWVAGKGKIDRAAVDTQVEAGLTHYVAAIELRRIALWLTMPDLFRQQPMLVQTTDGCELVDRWRAATEMARDDPDVPCERFVGPSQAIGDIANQHCAAATLHLWQWLFALSFRHPGAAAEALSRAHVEAGRMRQMWRLSNEPQLRAIRGEGAIKYELYAPGLEEKLFVAESVAQGRADSKAVVLQQSDRRVRERLASLERELGLRYAIANQRVPASLRTFVQALGTAQILRD